MAAIAATPKSKIKSTKNSKRAKARESERGSRGGSRGGRQRAAIKNSLFSVRQLSCHAHTDSAHPTPCDVPHSFHIHTTKIRFVLLSFFREPLSMHKFIIHMGPKHNSAASRLHLQKYKKQLRGGPRERGAASLAGRLGGRNAFAAQFWAPTATKTTTTTTTDDVLN